MAVNRSVPVRHGSTIVYAQTAEQAVDIALRLNTIASRNYGPDCSSGLFDRVGPIANQILELLSCHFRLHGKASKCLGTALRVSTVRQNLDDSLLKELAYISSGADAVRHLALSPMAATVKTLNARLASLPMKTDNGVESDSVDHVYVNDPWRCARIPERCISTRAWQPANPWQMWQPRSEQQSGARDSRRTTKYNNACGATGVDETTEVLANEKRCQADPQQMQTTETEAKTSKNDEQMIGVAEFAEMPYFAMPSVGPAHLPPQSLPLIAAANKAAQADRINTLLNEILDSQRELRTYLLDGGLVADVQQRLSPD